MSADRWIERPFPNQEQERDLRQILPPEGASAEVWAAVEAENTRRLWKHNSQWGLYGPEPRMTRKQREIISSAMEAMRRWFDDWWARHAA